MMRRKIRVISFIISLLLLWSCSDDQKAIELVTEEVERGSVLRNIERVIPNFIDQDLQSSFELRVEEQSITPGNDLDFVRLYLKFIDRYESGTGISTNEVVLKDILEENFEIGSDDLPRVTITVTYQEAIDALGIDGSLIEPGDQFELRAENFLTNGNTFSNDSASAVILTDYCFFKSPYRYVINVIDPIEEIKFIGGYTYEVLNATAEELEPFGLLSEGLTTITNGATPNTRNVDLFEENLEFTIAGAFIYPKIYQTIVSRGQRCRDSQTTILSGPAESSFGSYDLLDDTVLEMDILLDTEGPSPRQVRYRFTKQ